MRAASVHGLTGSKTDLGEQCMAWARPDMELPEDVMGAPAEQGVVLHALSETVAEGKPLDVALVTPDIEGRWAHLAPWLEQWRDATHGSQRLVEAAFKLDVHTRVVTGVPRSAGRDYGHTMTEVPARLDLGAVWPDRVEIWDIKTGETAPRAADAGQLKTLALMVCEAFGKSRAVVHIVHVRDDGVRVDSAELAQWDLDAHALMLRGALDSLPTAEPQPGSHCKYCPARTVCPAIVTAMVAAPSMAINTPEDIARVWPMLKPIEDAIAAIKSAIKAHVEAGGDLPLTNGRHLRMVRSGGGESVDLKSLAKAMGEDVMAKLRADGVVKQRAQGAYVKECG